MKCANNISPSVTPVTIDLSHTPLWRSSIITDADIIAPMKKAELQSNEVCFEDFMENQNNFP